MKTILALLAIPLAAFALVPLPLTYDGGKAFVNGTKLTAGQQHKITAVTAAGPVDFQRDGTVARTDSAAPFEFTWTPTVIGSHLFRAQASNGQWAEVTFNVVAVSPTPTSTPTPKPTPTPTASPSPSSTATPTPATPTPTATATATASPSPSSTPTATPTATPPTTPSATPSPTATSIPSATPTPTTPTPTPSVSPPPSPSPTLNAQWDPTQGHSYRIYVGRTSGEYFLWFDAGAGPTCHLALEPGTYYFALTAYNAAGESGKSLEIKYP